jgi:GNAT superfamily N-acetyltransferase
MTITIATEIDIDELALVEIESKKESIPDIIEDFEIDKELRVSRWITYFKGQSPQTSKPERVVFKALSENRIVGYLAGHLTTRFDMDAEIQSFYILKPYQRQGLGMKLLKKFGEWLISEKATRLCVGISPANIYKTFYLKNNGQYLNDHWIYWSDIKELTDTL